MKHREFWIDETDSHDGDLPIAFKEHPGQGPLLWQSSLIHVIEYAAYEELEAENARLREALEDQGKLVRRLSEMFKEDGV